MFLTYLPGFNLALSQPLSLTVSVFLSDYPHCFTVRCEMLNSATDQEFILQRKVSATPSVLLENIRKTRRRCTGSQSCSPLPQYYDDEGVNKRPKSEVSYGVPFKWSASRLMASQIKKSACGGNHNSTSACETLLNLPEWEIDKFINNMFQTPLALFNGDRANGDSVPSLLDETTAANRPDENLLWDGPDAAW